MSQWGRTELMTYNNTKAQCFSNLLHSRHTVRSFLPEPLEAETLKQILDDARHCASWSNTRPYRIAVATGEVLERLRLKYVEAFDASLPLQHREPMTLAKAAVGIGLPNGDFKTWKKYPKDLREASVKVGKALYTHMGIARGDREARDEAGRRNCEFFGAPAIALVFVHEGLLPFSAMDAGIMLQTLMLSARAHDVDTCPLGVLATWRHPANSEFEIPEQYRLITGIAMGYASDDTVNDFRAEHPEVQQLRELSP